MEQPSLERLAAGIKAAQAAGRTEDVRKLGAAFRALQAQQTAPGPSGGGQPQAETQGFFSSIGNAFRGTVDPILEGAGTTAEVLGAEGLGQGLKDAVELPENYASPSERFMNADEDGSFAWRFLPGAIGEQTGQFAGSLASRAIGGATGGALGSMFSPAGTAIGTAAGAFAGPAAFEAMQVLGPIAQERAKNDGRTEITREDIAYAASAAAASGALNSLAPGAQGMVRRMFLEGATEGTQSLIQQTGETALTERGLDLDARQALGEGIIGMGATGTVDTAISGTQAVADKVTPSRYDTGFNEADAAAAQRILDNADGDMDILRNVSTTESNKSAQGAAKAALVEARKELSNRISELRKLAKKNGDIAAKDAVDSLMATSGNMKSSVSEHSIQKVLDRFPGIREAEEAAQLAAEIRRIQPFTESLGDIGGFGALTRYLDPLDGRNSGITRAGAVMANVGLGMGGIAANRVLRGVDVLTNNRSKVKRYVESVQRENPQGFPEAQGQGVQDVLNEAKAKAQAERDAAKQAERIAKEQAKNQRNAQRMAENAAPEMDYTPEARAVEFLFEDGATVPESDPMFEGYRQWEARTGLIPSETLPVLEQLEREGAVPPNTAQRYRENIYSFSGKKNRGQTIAIQELVRQRANPEHRYTPPKEEVEGLVREIQATDVKPQGNRRKFKAREGERRRINLNSKIEANKNALSTQQYVELHSLAEAIDSPAMTREDRQALVDQELPRILRPRALRDQFAKEFGALAQIGNDYAIERQTEADPEEEAFSKKVEEVKAKDETRKSKKKAKKPAATPQPEPEPQQPKTPAERALRKLEEAPLDQSKEAPEDVPAPTAKATEAKEVTKPRASGNRASTAQMVDNRIEDKDLMARIAEGEAAGLADYISKLGKSADNRVERLIYEIASDQLNQNMITDRYASRFDVPPAEAARIVDEVLKRMETAGTIKRFTRNMNDTLVQNGKVKKSPDGQTLKVVSIEPVDQGLKDRVNIAKSARWYGKMVNQNGPAVEYTPSVVSDGQHRAFKDYSPEEIDGSFMPAIDFIQYLRNVQLAFDSRILDQIEEGLNVTDKDKQGTIRSVLNPVTGERVVKQRNGKVKKQTLRDTGPLDTVAQIFFQIGKKAEGRDNRFFQEWSAGRNLRVYSRNGLAHSQAGDIMKGLTRLGDKATPGQSGLDFIFHSIGNLMGADKEAPKSRREFIFDDPETIPNLIKFAENPFGKTTLVQSNGKTPTKIGKMVKDGEGFFQVLNAAHEVKSMISFARERNPKFKGTDAELLRDPDVRTDLAENYKTDFVVQLDASNNAYQLAGLAMGYPEVLQATGMAPQPGVTDPDSTKGADIYLAPAMSIAERIPELKALGLPQGKLRKLFKNPIGTYLYEAEYNSRKVKFKEQLGEIAEGAPIIGVGDKPGLIEMPTMVREGMMSEQGHTFLQAAYDANGDYVEDTPARKRVVEKDGKWFIETDKSKTGKGFGTGAKGYESADDAMSAAFEEDLYVRMDRELRREMNERFPRMRDYLAFSDAVSTIIKQRGEDGVNVRTPDGILLRTKFKDDKVFDRYDVDLGDGKIVPMGFDTGKTKITGRGVAAFLMHQLDAYVLRETTRRMRAEGLLKRGFNPIHDSFGFPPEDAQRGQEIWAEVMQELGSKDFNIFEMVMEENNISPAEIIRAKGTIPQRDPVTPVPARQIPTALS